jgi:hypothetical protein
LSGDFATSLKARIGARLSAQIVPVIRDDQHKTELAIWTRFGKRHRIGDPLQFRGGKPNWLRPNSFRKGALRLSSLGVECGWGI